MSSQILRNHQANNSFASNGNNQKNSFAFNAFNFAPGEDQSIRWLSRPNQYAIQGKYPHNVEKFRITFDAENFQPEQIKIYIQNHKLTVTGVYEEHSEGRHMQKQFEKSFDIPINADVEAMASFITPNHMLVVEIPLDANFQVQSPQMDFLNVNDSLNNQRRLSFSLNKFRTLNEQGLLPTGNQLSSGLTPPAQPVRRTSISKTTTTTTSTGSTSLSPEAIELLRNIDTTTSGTHSFSTVKTDRPVSNAGNHQIVIDEPNLPAPSIKTSTITNADLANLPIELPPELLANGGTITIQKRKVSVTKTADPNAAHLKSSSTGKNSISSPPLSPIADVPGPSHINERLSSKPISTNNQQRMFSLDEFLQNKTWNPSITDGMNGKKTLYMRLPLKPGTTPNQIKILLNGYDLRVEVENGSMNEHSYRQVTLFPTCEVEHLRSDLKNDGFLHIQVPIRL